MSLQGFYTTKGLALAAKAAAGAGLTVTKVTAGSGTTAASAAVLADLDGLAGADRWTDRHAAGDAGGGEGGSVLRPHGAGCVRE